MTFRISEKGIDVVGATFSELVVDSRFPHWKCDVAAAPKHYGYVDATVSVASGQYKIIHVLEHGYSHQPGFLVSWEYLPGDSTGATYGIGDMEIFAPLAATFKTRVDEKRLIIWVDNTDNISAINNANIKFRYYIFADDFPDYFEVPELNGDGINIEPGV